MSRRRWLLMLKGSAQIVYALAFFVVVVAALAFALFMYLRDHGGM